MTAPSFGEDVATLRAEVEAYWRDGQMPDHMTTLFDRIAAQAPVRAVGTDGRGVWRCACGSVRQSDGDPYSCSWCYKHGRWQPLYALGGA